MTTKTVKVVQQENGEAKVSFSWALQIVAAIMLAGFVSSVGIVLFGYPSLAGDVEENTEKIKAITYNQRKIDETVRNVEVDAKWNNLKADAIMDHLGIVNRPPRPKLEESKLRDIE